MVHIVCFPQEADVHLAQLGLPVRLSEHLWTETCAEEKAPEFFLKDAWTSGLAS